MKEEWEEWLEDLDEELWDEEEWLELLLELEWEELEWLELLLDEEWELDMTVPPYGLIGSAEAAVISPLLKS